MSPIFLLIVIFAVLGVASLGVLSTEIMINAQNLKVLPSITDIAGDPDDLTDGTFFCTCQNPSNPNESGPQFCLFGAGQPYEDSEMICTWEAAEDYYGDGDFYGEGCSIEFWKKHIGFDPEKYAKNVQQTSRKLTQTAWKLDKNAETDEEKLGALYAKQMSLVGKKIANTAQLIGLYQNGEDKNKILQEVLEMESLYDRMLEDTTSASEFLAKVTLLAETLMDDGQLIAEMNYEISPWPSGYEPKHRFNMMFQTNISLPPDHDPTLFKALKTDGKNIKQLLREAVAAMLNAAHPKVEYKYSVAEIMGITQSAIAARDYQTATDEFAKYNSLGSPICPAK